MQVTQPAPTTGKDARERLIEAAEELFAEMGYDATSVRHITTRAGCNLAAVNYHFHDKQTLYEEVFRRRFQQMRETRVASIKRVMAETQPTLEALLGAFARAFLEPLADKVAGSRFMLLFDREMVDRRLPKGMFLNEMAAILKQTLSEALRKLCPWLDEHSTLLVIHSLVGQLVHIIRLAAIVETEGAGGEYGFELSEAVEHIVRFSAAGIRSYAGEVK